MIGLAASMRQFINIELVCSTADTILQKWLKILIGLKIIIMITAYGKKMRETRVKLDRKSTYFLVARSVGWKFFFPLLWKRT